MVFSSAVFLFLFLPFMLLVYFVIPRAMKNYWLLAGSLFFYAWGEPRFVFIMMLSIAANYIFARLVDSRRDSPIQVKWILGIMITVNVGLLAVFKYTDFVVGNINALFGTAITIPNIPLPIGISFFTFQSISYVIDVYRKDGHVQRNPFHVGLYIALFPQLIAGPIVRYRTIAKQIHSRKETIQKFIQGTKRLIIGLGKKVFLADSIAKIVDQIFAQNPADMSTGLVWIGLIAFSLQIYFDFSGYSDIAIGLGKMFGFDFLENFNYPYMSRSFGEFWRRWNISLGTWFRDYVYIPLGGSRNGTFNNYRNLFIIWVLTGTWHGADWTYVAWGAYNALFIMLEVAFIGNLLKKAPRFIEHLYALFFIVIGFAIFRASNMAYAFSYLGTMFGLNGIGIWGPNAQFQTVQNSILLIIAIIGTTPLMKQIKKWIEMKAESSAFMRLFGRGVAITGSYATVFFISVVFIIANTFSPFYYFRF